MYFIWPAPNSNQSTWYFANTKDTPDLYGGKIGRKANGEPSGFLANMANNLVKVHFPKPDIPLEWYMDVCKRAARRGNEVGLTGMHDAIKMYTLDAAYAVFAEDNQGSIKVGKLADFTICELNLMEIDPTDVLKMNIEMTIVDDKIVYERFRNLKSTLDVFSQ